MTTPFTQLPIITDLTLRLISDPHHEHALQIDFFAQTGFQEGLGLICLSDQVDISHCSSSV